MQNKLVQIPQNYRNSIDWIMNNYESANVSFPNGFQKDAIQNAVGARKYNKWNNWHFDLYYIENDNGKFIVIEDTGTVGLTGKNISTREVNEKISKGETLPPTERLARFNSTFNSGGNTTGGGLYGAGKSVYNAASKDYWYIYDSLREDGLYVANQNKIGQVFDLALENDEAKEFIKKETGLSPKNSVGTRIIIKNPVDELIESIDNKTIENFIIESWWRIIERFGDNCSIRINGNEITLPQNLKKCSHSYELPREELYLEGYRVKHFGLFIYDDGKNPFNGISYYRKGMKIGTIDLGDTVATVARNYWGYIEVDKEWEDELAQIEDAVHFGVRNKTRRTYQNLKNYCINKTDQLLKEWGYKKDNKSKDQKLQEEISEVAEELQNLFDNLGYENLGKGPKKPTFNIRWKKIEYPDPSTERVTSYDVIKYSFRISNNFNSIKNFKYKLDVINPLNQDVVSSIDSGSVKINSGEFFDKECEFKVSTKNSLQFKENRIVLTVSPVNSSKAQTRDIRFFFDCDKPSNQKDSVTMKLHNIVFPRENSIRVDFGEKIRNVSYWIENKRNIPLKYQLDVYILDTTTSNKDKICDVGSITGEIPPYTEIVTQELPDIIIDENLYSKHFSKGTIELRAKLIALENDEQFEKGDKITRYYFTIYINKDEKSGKYESFKPTCVDLPDDYRRSWCKVNPDREITINIGHVAYKLVDNDQEYRHRYFVEQMLKQYVLLYLKEGKFDLFVDKESGLKFEDLDQITVVENVLRTIEKTYYNQLG